MLLSVSVPLATLSLLNLGPVLTKNFCRVFTGAVKMSQIGICIVKQIITLAKIDYLSRCKFGYEHKI